MFNINYYYFIPQKNLKRIHELKHKIEICEKYEKKATQVNVISS